MDTHTFPTNTAQPEQDLALIYPTKRELAMAYSPGMSYESASRRLRRWINHNPDLVNALRKTGYNRQQRKLSNSQISIILHYIGEP